MNKTPGEVLPPEPMTTAERNARKAFRKVEEKQAMTDHETAQKAFAKNHARLRAERLAREAASPPVAKAKAKPRSKGKSDC
jgi:hypothetical protein